MTEDGKILRETFVGMMVCQGDAECRCMEHSAIAALDRMEAERERLRGALEEVDATLCECRYSSDRATTGECNCDVHAAHRIIAKLTAEKPEAPEWYSENQKTVERGNDTECDDAETLRKYVPEEVVLQLQAKLATANERAERAETERDHTRDWYGSRWQRMHEYFRAPEMKDTKVANDWFSIVANGGLLQGEPPVCFMAKVNGTRYRLKEAERQRDAARQDLASAVEALRPYAQGVPHINARAAAIVARFYARESPDAIERHDLVYAVKLIRGLLNDAPDTNEYDALTRESMDFVARFDAQGGGR